MARCIKCKRIIPKNSGYYNLPSGITCIACSESKVNKTQQKRETEAVEFMIACNLWDWINARGGMQVGKEELIQLLVKFKYET
jgi:hypothetical protein